jgi:hypothetical protein
LPVLRQQPILVPARQNAIVVDAAEAGRQDLFDKPAG